MSKRQQGKRSTRAQVSTTPNSSKHAVVDAYGGWTVAASGSKVVGVCRCGESAVIDCPVCGPQCMGCFVRGG